MNTVQQIKSDLAHELSEEFNKASNVTILKLVVNKVDSRYVKNRQEKLHEAMLKVRSFIQNGSFNVETKYQFLTITLNNGYQHVLSFGEAISFVVDKSQDTTIAFQTN